VADIKLDINTELSMLKEALKENEDLYDEVKEHYDKVRKGGSGTLQFVEKQTSNLISLKSNKVSIIQNIINTKKAKAELELKVINANKGQDGSDENILKLANSMYDLILHNKGDKSFDDIMGTQKNEELISDEEDVDALLEARLAEEEAKSPEPEEAKKEDKPKIIYVVDMNKNIYAVDEDYNIMEDAPIPDMNISIIEDGDEYIAKDDLGNTYDVVEFE